MCQDEHIKSIGRGKRRNAEKRKEKSRDAARSRRSKEATVFAELSSLMPVPTSTLATLDKASMMRLCISYLKLRTLGGKIKHKLTCESVQAVAHARIEEQYLKCLNGFLVTIDKEGDLVYVSENVIKHLGISQFDLMGQNIYEYSHPCDHDEIKDILSQKKGELLEETFFARLKCTLTTKGRNVNLKSATFKVIRFRGHHLDIKQPECWVLIGEPIPHPSYIDVPLDSYAFLSRHSMDMKFTYCDERVRELLGYNPEHLIGITMYDFHHALDGEYMDKSYQNLFSKGQMWTDSYRFLACGGGYVWLETQATVVHNSKTDKPHCVLCVHYLISEVEEPDCIMSEVQLPVKKEKPEPLKLSLKQNSSKKGPVLSMDSIFVPRTKDMDSSVCAPKRKLNEEPVDLGHLAPTSGDEVVPLGFDPHDGVMSFLSDMLLHDPEMGMNMDKKCQDGPFNLSLHDERTRDYTDSSNSDTPNLEQLTDRGQHEVTRGQTMFPPEMEDIDMTYRAPFIPMSGEEDLEFNTVPPVPLIDDHYNATFQMLGTTETIFNPKQDEPENNRKHGIPMSLLRKEAMDHKERQYKELDHLLVHPKQHASVETNHLETGPPVKRSRHMDLDDDMPSSPESGFSIDLSQIKDNGEDVNSIKGSNILKNLLLNGEDKGTGYELNIASKNIIERNKKLPGECEVLRDLLTGPLEPSLYAPSPRNSSPMGTPSPITPSRVPSIGSTNSRSPTNSPGAPRITVKLPRAEGGFMGFEINEEILQLLNSYTAGKLTNHH